MVKQINFQGKLVKTFEILVPSRSRPGMVAHKVVKDIQGKWSCSCEAFRYSKHNTHPQDWCKDGEKACIHIKRGKKAFEVVQW